MKTERIILFTFAAVLTTLCVTAMQSTALAADESSAPGKVTVAEKNFMVAAAESGMFEVRAGEIAELKGTKEDVKDFGAMMVTDHGKAGEDLKAVAAKLDVTLPSDLDGEHKATVDRLNELTGAAFDKAYVDEMVKAHTKDVSAFQQASKNAKDGDVKAFAQRTLPVIIAHLKKVKTMMDGGGEKKEK
jgi:putative membrane protein